MKLLLEYGADANIHADGHASPLYEACQKRDEEMVELLLAYGADPNIWQWDKRDYALQKACINGDEKMVSSLLNSKARTALYCGYYDNPLQTACVCGNESIVRMLLSHGADATGRGGVFDNAMLAAVDGGNKIIIDILLDHGLSINEKGGKATYPLLRALSLEAYDGQESLINHLLVRGADPNLELEGDRGVLQAHRMCRSALQHAESTFLTATLLDHGAQINAVVGNYNTALLVAASWKSKDVIRLLIDRGADVNLSAWFFGSPLIAACQAGRFEVAKLLVEAGADLDAKNLVGHSALLTTCLSHMSQLELFEYLIHQGADALQEDKRGCNGLHYAARANKGDFMKRMLACRINVNATDRDGWSPLHWAVASTKDSVECVNLLLESGCDKSKIDKQGRTALDMAKFFKKTEEAAILSDHTHAHTKSSEHDESIPQSIEWHICDGCDVVSKPQPRVLTELIGLKERKYCNPERWHHCQDCIDFDFCFRCILDKDIIHFKDHRFSDEPA